MQAAIRHARRQAVRQSLCGYSLLFGRFLPAAFLAGNDPTRRQRLFGHVPVFWAWLAQILEANSSCSKALGLLQAWYRASAMPVPASGTSGYCQARLRIREDFLRSAFDKTGESLARSIRPCDRWHGHVLKAIDGSSTVLMDTPANQAAYPQPTTQKPGCGFPTMGIVGVLNLSHGGWEGFETCDHRTHDSRVAPRLMKHLDEGDILLADRAFCTYELISRLCEKGAHTVMRLHQARHAKLDWRRGKKLGAAERLVTWQKPAQQPAGSQLSREQWAVLPDQLTLRYIKLGYEDRAGMKRALVVVTTLLDTSRYPAEEVANLYARRWEIELKLRDIKTTLGMERFTVKSPAMACKTLWMMMIAYNLTRCLMQQAAAEAGKPLAHMSFKGILDHLVASRDFFSVHRAKPRLLAARQADLIETCANKVLPIRPFRREPRALKRRPKNYPLLTQDRHVFRETPHRGNPHSVA